MMMMMGGGLRAVQRGEANDAMIRGINKSAGTGTGTESRFPTP